MRAFKRTFSLLLVLAVVFASVIVASAENQVICGDFILGDSADNNSLEVAKYEPDGVYPNVYVYGAYNDVKITAIRKSVFSGRTEIKKVTLNENLVRIEEYGFLNCTNLETINFPDTLTTIGTKAFYNCPKLTKITLGTNVTTIASDAFENCPDLVIYCYTNSPAHTFAVNNNIDFVLIDAPKDKYLVGDTDGNGSVTISDVTVIQKLLAGLAEDDGLMSQRGNIDGKDDLSITDATLIQQYLANLVSVQNENINTEREYN